MSEKHTPGPWWLGTPRKDGYISVSGNKHDDLARVVWQMEDDRYCRSNSPEQEANARLIAAAPDLLEALIEALPYVESCEYDNGYKLGAVAKVVRNMNAAILKARATPEQG